MVFLDTIFELSSFKPILISCLIGIILFFLLTVLLIKIYWFQIKKYWLPILLVAIFIGPGPVILLWLVLFGFTPVVLDYFIPIEASKEYDVKIAYKKIGTSGTLTTTTTNLEGKKIENKTTYPSYNIYVKKWWDNQSDNIFISVDKAMYDKLKKGQTVKIKSHKGLLGIRHIDRDEDFMKVVENKVNKEN